MNIEILKSCHEALEPGWSNGVVSVGDEEEKIGSGSDSRVAVCGELGEAGDGFKCEFEFGSWWGCE